MKSWPSKTRRLTDNEIKLHLVPTVDSGACPDDALSLIKINSTYIEIVDTGYQWIGIATSISSVVIGMILWFNILIIHFTYTNYNTDRFAADLLFTLFVAFFSSLFLALFYWLIRFEVGRWTNYPVRMNRKNRMVYKFQRDGTVISAPWDKIHFCQSANTGGTMDSARLRGVILDEDGVTVLHSFSFGTQFEDHRGTLAQWEFFRRYMENGPKDLIDSVTYLMPVADRRESYWTGLERISAHFPGFLRIIMLPFSIWVSLGRWVAMHTSKIPVWPKEVEEACLISSKDKYIKDYQANPKDLQ
jgi:hypothetical protein